MTFAIESNRAERRGVDNSQESVSRTCQIVVELYDRTVHGHGEKVPGGGAGVISQRAGEVGIQAQHAADDPLPVEFEAFGLLILSVGVETDRSRARSIGNAGVARTSPRP